jgi:hypothetical protein
MFVKINGRTHYLWRVVDYRVIGPPTKLFVAKGAPGS